MEEKTFHFVNGSGAADKASSTLMRRHVMKGKNAGKTFHRRSRLELAGRGPSNAADTPLRIPNTIMRGVGHAVPLFPFPVPVTPHTLKVVDDFFSLTAEWVYPIKLGLSFEDAKFAWFQYMLGDEATYHCNIALMQAGNELMLGNGESSPKALYYLSQTFAQVKKRLEGADALSDSTIAIVVSLITQEQIRNQHLQAKIHVEGLRRMVKLRGGLAQLEGALPLVLKICKADITFSLQNGGPTMFFRDRMSETRVALASKGLRLDRACAAASVRHSNLDPDLREVLLDIMSISSLFNSKLHNSPVDLFAFQEMQTSIGYRLLRYHPLDAPRLESNIDTAYHAGLTIFMMTTFLQSNRRRIVKYGLVSAFLEDILRSWSDENESELGFWLMVIGGIWVSGDGDDAWLDWLAPRIRSVARLLGFRTWEEALELVSTFPWINVIHDQPGRELWDKALQTS